MADESYGPGAGPAPVSLPEEELSNLIAGQRFGALATTRSSGVPHLSTVVYSWDAEQRVARISTIADRLKVRQLQRDPRGSLYVTSDDFWSFAVAEGKAELSPVSAEPGDEVGRELLAMAGGLADPAREEAFLRQMAADRRMVIRLRVSRLYGTTLPVAG
ncbi:PPOX class F420-dependent oxidoreductase [Nonomuraea sp. 3-1Str]|uniref:PPOX class F420-dependent oxidoreductase n=1 Tax=unclassified Nonomuraea TaxID=2593643 RepID=UPI00285D063E|nr:PPOX class F420-dependent oxidoreductase [Nonomuraea sp. 3-1Str]MDR8411531.1 PPOX class F420-dependent oxidoreductase [Nonomuraea sp. 3-1Str]